MPVLDRATRLEIEAVMLRKIIEKAHGPLSELAPFLIWAAELTELEDHPEDDARRLEIHAYCVPHEDIWGEPRIAAERSPL